MKNKIRLNRKAVEAFVKTQMVPKPMRLSDLGRMVKLSSGYLSQVLNGQRSPSIAVRLRFMEVMGLKETDASKLYTVVRSKKK